MVGLKKQVFVHIGTNKTGTSSIQHLLATNRDVLIDNNVCYPRLLGDEAAHHQLYLWLSQSKKHKKELQHFLREIKPFGKVILSSEALCDLRDPNSLKSLLKDWDVKIIMYLRDPVRYSLSWWQQDIQMGKRFEDPASYLRVKKRSYLELVRRWENVFGRSNLRIRVYDREHLPQGDIVRDFKELTEIDGMTNLVRLPWENNPSISGNLLYFKLIYNSLRLPEPSSQKMIDGLTDASKLDPKFRIVPKVHESLISVTNDLYEDELNALRSEYGIDIPRTSTINGVRIPDLETIRRDFRKVMEFSEEKGLPLAEMAKYVKF